MNRIFRPSEVARFCQVDPKTVHNWVEKGKLKAFRTPGRHVRVEEAALRAFLVEYGFPMPAELQDGGAR